MAQRKDVQEGRNKNVRIHLTFGESTLCPLGLKQRGGRRVLPLFKTTNLLQVTCKFCLSQHHKRTSPKTPPTPTGRIPIGGTNPQHYRTPTKDVPRGAILRSKLSSRLQELMDYDYTDLGGFREPVSF
jgi:hypothetical protein